jgi:hypothetical protein
LYVIVVNEGEKCVGSPVEGSSHRGAFAGLEKSNAPNRDPAFASNDPPPILPRFQLSSMNRRMEVWSGQCVEDKVRPRPRRDHEDWQPRAVSALILERSCSGRVSAESSGTEECVILRVVGLANDRWHHVVVPTVGVVISDEDRGALPEGRSLEEV